MQTMCEDVWTQALSGEYKLNATGPRCFYYGGSQDAVNFLSLQKFYRSA